MQIRFDIYLVKPLHEVGPLEVGKPNNQKQWTNKQQLTRKSRNTFVRYLMRHHGPIDNWFSYLLAVAHHSSHSFLLAHGPPSPFPTAPFPTQPHYLAVRRPFIPYNEKIQEGKKKGYAWVWEMFERRKEIKRK